MHEHEFTVVAFAPWVDFTALDAGTTSARDERDWLERRDQLATAWVLARGEADRCGLVLRVPSHADVYRRGQFRALAGRSEVITNRGRQLSRGGAILVPCGYPREIAGGMDCADGTGIVVTEHLAWPLEGWAMALGALNLRTLKATADQRTDEQREDLEDLVGMLYNGWSSAPGRRAASQLMPKLAESGMSWTVFFGSVLAADPSRFDEQSMKKYAPKAWREDLDAIHKTCMRRL
jgi:hypothetical protein